MKKFHIQQEPSNFDEYIHLVDDIELMDAFQESIEQIKSVDISQLSKNNAAYAPGKWTIKQVIQHVSDEERVMSYRAMLFARNEITKPNIVDPEFMNTQSNTEARTMESMLEELMAVRVSTVHLFKSFNDEALLRKGYSWKYHVSVLSVGFFLIGHQIHHFNVIKERYLKINP